MGQGRVTLGLALGAVLGLGGCGESARSSAEGPAGAGQGTGGSSTGGATGGVGSEARGGQPAAGGARQTGGVGGKGGGVATGGSSGAPPAGDAGLGTGGASGASGATEGGRAGGVGHAGTGSGATGGTISIGTGGVSSCATGGAGVLAPPLDLFFVLDTSDAMLAALAAGSGGATKWSETVAGLRTFFATPGGATSAALGYYPKLAAEADVCDESAYELPAVDFTALPADDDTLAAALDARVPHGDAPAVVALSGSLSHARVWADLHPEHQVVLVLVTGSVPNACGNTGSSGQVPSELAVLTAVAQEAFAPGGMIPSIPLYVIDIFGDGEGAPLGGYDDVAQAGGTRGARLVSAEPGFQTSLVRALTSIAADATACQLSLVGPSGQMLDPRLVNLQVDRNGTPTIVPNVAVCDPSTGGWYLDAASASRLILCPSTCDQLRADPNANLRILVGCTTRTN